jgi:hypothetical protein
MADFVTLHIVGGNQFVIDLVEWGQTLRLNAKVSALEAAARIAESARTFWSKHEKTGRLAASISITAVEDDGVIFQYRVRSDDPKAGLFEFGTNKIRPINRSSYFSPRVTSRRLRGSETPYRAHRRVFLPGIGFRQITNTGQMPGHPMWIPTAVRERGQFIATLARLISEPAPKIGNGRSDVMGVA